MARLWREGGMWRLRVGRSTLWHPKLRAVARYYRNSRGGS